MERYYGFDLGDAESAIARLGNEQESEPGIIQIQGTGSFITAYAVMAGGEMLIGENACYQAGAVKRRIRFKRNFLTEPESSRDVRNFAAGVLGILKDSGEFEDTGECCFYIGCPAGWNKNAREQYRAIFEQAHFPPVRIISESRAAMVSACQSRHLQVGYDILSRPVLVVDIGSSTTDFAYVCNGKEVEMQTAGEVMLGGGMMDELLLERCIRSSDHAKELRDVFQESEAWRSYCEFAARKLKEKYYADPEYWAEHPCVQTLRIVYDRPLLLTLRMDAHQAQYLEEGAIESLSGKSFREVFEQSLRNVRDNIQGDLPQLLFLTGGVSRLPAVRKWCEHIFPEAVVICGSQPEYAVARGLAWSGKIDAQMRDFRRELDELKASTNVEKIVGSHILGLYRMVVDTMVDPIIEQAAIPVFSRWRSGSIKRLSDTDQAMQEAIEAYLHTDEARERMLRVMTRWLRPVADQLEEYTVPICIRHHVPYTALSLNSYLRLSDIDIRIDARDVFAVEEITWMIDSLISLTVGLLCGGSGIALISSGPAGILAGTAVSLMLLALGKEKMEGALLDANLPRPMRHLVSERSMRSRKEEIADQVKARLYKSLEREKNDEITARMTEEISQQIETCLTRMAEVVEIPLDF